MTEKVRYEIRTFSHKLIEENGTSLPSLLSPLEGLCLEFGGYPGTENRRYAGERASSYIVGKENGALAHVLVKIDLNSAWRETFVVNLENYEHKELLAALHEFYSGKLRYRGMPEPEIMEREVKSK